jgi:hypothetical protein
MSKDKKVRVAIVGVGNCASALVQGVHYYCNVKVRPVLFSGFRKNMRHCRDLTGNMHTETQFIFTWIACTTVRH